MATHNKNYNNKKVKLYTIKIYCYSSSDPTTWLVNNVRKKQLQQFHQHHHYQHPCTYIHISLPPSLFHVTPLRFAFLYECMFILVSCAFAAHFLFRWAKLLSLIHPFCTIQTHSILAKAHTVTSPYFCILAPRWGSKYSTCSKLCVECARDTFFMGDLFFY